MPPRLLMVLTVVLGAGLLAVHVAAKQRPDPADITRVASSFQQNARWDGKVAPAFEVEQLDGTTFRLADHVGREVVILNFFATWCGPCKAEMPELDRLAREMAGRPVTILAVDAEEKRDLVKAFVGGLGVTFPVAVDDSGAVLKQFGVDSFPTTVFIAPDGTIRLYQVGPVLNADVAFGQLLSTAFAEIAAGAGVTRESFLEAQAKTAPGLQAGDAALNGRAARIAADMSCPCGCDHKVSGCTCSTAKAIRKRLAADANEVADAEAVRALNRDFCMKRPE
jgi:thiol-disulfide isomerase/thioredoxin